MIAAIVFFIAVWLNRKDASGLLLTLLVYLTYILPVELITDRNLWYAACISAEIFVLGTALRLKCHNSLPIAICCIYLLAGHIASYFAETAYSNSVYCATSEVMEFLEILCCAIYSKPVVAHITNKLRV